jgi:hypothetical protein
MIHTLDQIRLLYQYQRDPEMECHCHPKNQNTQRCMFKIVTLDRKDLRGMKGVAF